jgi:WXXGXW repeat (2 copies)
MMNVKSLRVALAGALLSAALSACVVAPAPGYYSGEVVAAAPPPLQYEPVVGVAPGPGYFWIGGGWFWEGGRYAWHPGYWQAPRPGYHWVARGWARVGGGWRVREGHWERR